ncbi:MAG: hypothetical protein QM607_01560 [Microbacterium sp.]
MDVPLELSANAILALALLAWVGYRQTTWRRVDAARMWRAPVILAVAGLATLSGQHGWAHVSALDVSLLLVELVLSCGVGAVMGAISRFRPAGDGLETRAGWVGLALWLVLIALRIALSVFAARLGADLTASTGMILLLVGANRAARALVILRRAARVGA